MSVVVAPSTSLLVVAIVAVATEALTIRAVLASLVALASGLVTANAA